MSVRSLTPATRQAVDVAIRVHRDRALAQRQPTVGVAFVTTHMGIGGAERLLVDLIRGLDPRRFKPALLCLKEPGPLAEQLAADGVPVHGRLMRRRLDLTVISRLTRVLRQEQASVVCTVGTGGDRSFYGRLAAWRMGAPAIVSCPHSMGVPDRYELPNRLLGAITDAHIAVANLQKQYLVETVGIPASRIRVVHNGVSVDRFSPGAAPSAIRKSLSIACDAPVAGVVSKLRSEKNLTLFLRAAAAVKSFLPAAEFIVVGDGPERATLELFARQCGIASAVHFVGIQENVVDWIRAMDVCTLTSICEAFPVCLLEAMACAKPVIATDVGAVHEMVAPGESGVLVPSNDLQALVTALRWLLSDRLVAGQMGQRARATVEDRFALEAMVRGYDRVFEDLLIRKQVWRPIPDDSVAAG